MPRWLQILSHLALTGLGAYASYSTGTPLPLVLSAGAQTALGGLAQLYNTDGTKQETAYVAPDKK